MVKINEINGENEKLCEVNITDEILQTLDTSDIEKVIPSGRRNIKLYVDSVLKLDDCFSILEKLESLVLSDGTISIYTTGRNFNELMKAIKLRKSDIHHELHVDDNDIRTILDVNNIICGLNFSRISCDCYFSDRYLVNFNPGDYIRLCGFPEVKFNRRRVDKLRSVIEEVWMELVPSIYSSYALPGVAKVEMVLDYISGIDNVLEKYCDNDGTVLSKTQLAALLLDNYFAQVDCRIIKGNIFPIMEDCVWLATRHGGKTYGHSLECDLRFSDLEKLGYINGVTALDNSHEYRSDYSYSIDSYSELDEIAYFNMKSSLDNVRSTFIFPPTIIPGDDFFNVDSYYHDVSPKNNSKLPWKNRQLTVKGAPRKLVDKAHVKKKFSEQFYKRYR